ncbi:Zinc finger, RING/FYVE/PHD-type, partial [Lasallia pustulata]
MSAVSIDTFVLDFPDPQWSTSVEKYRVNASISFDLFENTNLRTLSTDSVDAGDTVAGLLYVPDLTTSDPCYNTSKQYIPHNVTRQANLPSTDYSLIAIAPWISPNCTESYLAAAHGPARAFIFYLLNNATSLPPPVSSAVWGLQDGGQWKFDNKYPVYAVPMQLGNTLMQQLAQYSGNMTNVKNGHLLTEQYDSRDYVRLYTEIDTDVQSSMPSLWVFILIILAILVVVLCATASLMHYVQHAGRQSLRRRVASGEVDLEALGIKRMTVPQNLLDKMALFVYVHNKQEFGEQNDEPPVAVNARPDSIVSASAKPLPQRGSELCHESASINIPPPNAYVPAQNCVSSEAARDALSQSTLPRRQLPFAQPTCPICLDDFISDMTTVRELPCGHIYHPECIDPFLRANSSLCPLCKARVLPAGYCPTNVTNAMVRRERLVRRMRERVTVESPVEDNTATVRAPVSVGRRMASFHRQFGGARHEGRRISSLPSPGAVEMGQAPRRSRSDALPPTRAHGVLPAAVPGRTANTILEDQRTAEDLDREAQARLSK